MLGDLFEVWLGIALQATSIQSVLLSASYDVCGSGGSLDSGYIIEVWQVSFFLLISLRQGQLAGQVGGIVRQ